MATERTVRLLVYD